MGPEAAAQDVYCPESFNFSHKFLLWCLMFPNTAAVPDFRLLRGNVLICGSLGLFDYFAALFNCLVYIIIILPAGFNQEYLSRFLLKLASQHHI